MKIMTPEQKKKAEEIVKELKKKKSEFQDRYGDDWESVMYGTANKLAMHEAKDITWDELEKDCEEDEEEIDGDGSNIARPIITGISVGESVSEIAARLRKMRNSKKGS